MSNRRLLLGQTNDQLGDGIALDSISFLANSTGHTCRADVEFNDDFIGGTPTKITIPKLAAGYIAQRPQQVEQPFGLAWLDVDLGWGFAEGNQKNGLFIGSSSVIETFNETGSGATPFPYYPWIFYTGDIQYAGTYYALPSTRPYNIPNMPVTLSNGFTGVIYDTGAKSNQVQLTISDSSYNFVSVAPYYNPSNYPLPNRTSSKMRLRFSGEYASIGFNSFLFLLEDGTKSYVKPFIRGGTTQSGVTSNPEIGLYCDKTGKCLGLNFIGHSTGSNAYHYKNGAPSIIYY